MNKYTITQFRNDYPDNDACLNKLFQLRYSNLICPKCDADKPFKRVKNKKSYQCPCCGFHGFTLLPSACPRSKTADRLRLLRQPPFAHHRGPGETRHSPCQLLW